MIIKIMDSLVLSCDKCGESVTRPFGRWDDAFEYAMVNNWKANMDKKGYEIKHVCPNCQKGYCHG